MQRRNAGNAQKDPLHIVTTGNIGTVTDLNGVAIAILSDDCLSQRLCQLPFLPLLCDSLRFETYETFEIGGREYYIDHILVPHGNPCWRMFHIAELWREGLRM